MKYLLLCLTLLLAGCIKSTDYGPCIGILDDKNPTLHYRVSTNNVVVGVIFSELIIPPIVVLLDELQCPNGSTVK